MKILRQEHENVNSIPWFDNVWKLENVHRYDAVRLRAFLEPMDETKTLLDVGAGWWGVAQYAMQHGFQGKYVAIDYSEEARRRTLEVVPTVDYRIGDARHLPFNDRAFDVVACGELIEHFAEPTPLVNELNRVCKPGGHIILSTLDANCEAAKARQYPEHMIMWDTPDEVAEYFKPFGECRAWVLGHYLMVNCRKYS